MIAQGRTTPQVTGGEGTTVPTGKPSLRWRREKCAMKVDQPKRLKTFEQDIQRLRRSVSDLTWCVERFRRAEDLKVPNGGPCEGARRAAQCRTGSQTSLPS